MARILAIDGGTTGVTALIVGDDASVVAKGYREFPQHFPRPGWVEHDAGQIWEATQAAVADALAQAGIEASGLAAIGITNQRETTVLWERSTLKPVSNAIVWQDRRTARRCDELRDREPAIRARTGLVLDAYFSATKIHWMMENVDGVRAAARRGDLAFGTIDSWLVAKLTGGAVHATDPSNASRTLLYNIYERDWDDELLDIFGVPRSLLPEVLPSSGRFGTTDPGSFFGAAIPVAGIAGDQQSALFGQACFEPGMTKNTYGTGSFVLMNTGTTAPPPPDGLLVTVAWGLGGETFYAMEGSIFVTGAAIQWLRDGLGIIESASETGPLAESVPDNGGVYFVPALTGLGSPWWDPYARGTIVGITRGSTRAHLARAAVEAMAYQTRDVVETMMAKGGVELSELRVDGGASVMDLLCRFQADQLGVVVRRPASFETTGLGAAFLAGLAEGVWASTADIGSLWRVDAEFMPRDPDPRGYAGWQRAVERARDWARD
ncbi:MAG TPA: glycerol kinase GlpK [Actinomycetota bacterium]|nr:glycerol kinase GlpK [Actinomycetota bacterium]